MISDCTRMLLCLCFVTSVLSLVSGLTFKDRINRTKRANGMCSNDSFRCVTSGECLPIIQRCDGKEDCKDRSDEFDDCKSVVQCPGFLFTCNYGACIELTKQCNGKKDCRDGSDEVNCTNSVLLENKVSGYGNCKSNEFRCDSGQCISRDDKCNGIAECTDRSDETSETCLNTYCPGFTFKCDYGACVNGFAECDGVQDCIDKSDEKNCEPVVTPKQPVIEDPSPTKGCILPAHPTNGQWTVSGSVQLQPNSKIGVNSILTYACNSGYQLSSGSKILACLSDGWHDQFPTCQKRCQPLYSTAVTMVNCENEKKQVIKCNEATEGVIAKFECASYYEPTDRSSTYRYCYDGSWNLPAPQCIPVCGEKRVTAEPLIVNGKDVEIGNYPWVTAIFQKDHGKFVNVCGGSMLTQKVIITAAHCVSTERGEPLENDLIRVAVGKYYNSYENVNDTQAQYSTVDKILIHTRYKGESQRFASDIAFLVTTDVLLLSKVVQPVCYHNIDNMHLTTNMEGVITGWGYTLAGGTPSPTLKEITIPYKDDATCSTELPPEWADQYFAYDKLCAGHYNKSIAVCKGDSGGGLVFPNSRDGRYYIHGLVSIGHRTQDGCDIQLSALFTKVASHSEWMDQITAQYK